MFSMLLAFSVLKWYPAAQASMFAVTRFWNERNFVFLYGGIFRNLLKVLESLRNFDFEFSGNAWNCDFEFSGNERYFDLNFRIILENQNFLRRHFWANSLFFQNQPGKRNLKTTFSCGQQFGSLCVKFWSGLRISGRLTTLSARGCGQKISTQPKRNVAYRDWLGFLRVTRRYNLIPQRNGPRAPKRTRGTQHSNNKCNPILTNDQCYAFSSGK